MVMNFGIVSEGVFAPPILMTPRVSLQKLSCGRVVAPLPSMMGSSPPGPATPRTVMGAAAVP